VGDALPGLPLLDERAERVLVGLPLAVVGVVARSLAKMSRNGAYVASLTRSGDCSAGVQVGCS
jgi:hypothetical protein